MEKEIKEFILECEIPGRCRSLKNNKRIIFIRGRRLIIPSKAYEEWKEIALQYLLIAKGKSPFGFPLPFPIHVAALFYFDKQPADLDNCLNSVAEITQKSSTVLNDNMIQSFDGSRVYKCSRGKSKTIIKIFRF